MRSNTTRLTCRFDRLALVVLFAAFFLSLPSLAEDKTNAIAVTERAWRSTHAEYLLHPKKIEAANAFSRACFERADLCPDDSTRAALGKEGVAAAQAALSLQSTNAEAHYNLGLNLGEVARTKHMSALKLVAEMEEEFLIARSLDEKLDYAGPDRCLGMLYRDAPGWPVSIGNRSKARQHLLRTLDLAPEFPENWLTVIETYLEWDDPTRASRDAALLQEIWPKAKTTFVGEKWEPDWEDWTVRWEKIQKKLADKLKPAKHR